MALQTGAKPVLFSSLSDFCFWKVMRTVPTWISTIFKMVFAFCGLWDLKNVFYFQRTFDVLKSTSQTIPTCLPNILDIHENMKKLFLEIWTPPTRKCPHNVWKTFSNESSRLLRPPSQLNWRSNLQMCGKRRQRCDGIIFAKQLPPLAVLEDASFIFLCCVINDLVCPDQGTKCITQRLLWYFTQAEVHSSNPPWSPFTWHKVLVQQNPVDFHCKAVFF